MPRKKLPQRAIGACRGALLRLIRQGRIRTALYTATDQGEPVFQVGSTGLAKPCRPLQNDTSFIQAKNVLFDAGYRRSPWWLRQMLRLRRSAFTIIKWLVYKFDVHSQTLAILSVDIRPSISRECGSIRRGVQLYHARFSNYRFAQICLNRPAII